MGPWTDRQYDLSRQRPAHAIPDEACYICSAREVNALCHVCGRGICYVHVAVNAPYAPGNAQLVCAVCLAKARANRSAVTVRLNGGPLHE